MEAFGTQSEGHGGFHEEEHTMGRGVAADNFQASTATSLNVSNWDDQGLSSHLPTAIIGLGPTERAQYFLKKREEERKEGEKLREAKRKSLEMSQKRLRESKHVDDHFTSRTIEQPELKAGLSGLVKKNALTEGEATETKSAEELERERKQAKKLKKKKRAQDRQKLSFQDEGDGEDEGEGKLTTSKKPRVDAPSPQDTGQEEGGEQ